MNKLQGGVLETFICAVPRAVSISPYLLSQLEISDIFADYVSDRTADAFVASDNGRG
jgi:hypothetical protein